MKKLWAGFCILGGITLVTISFQNCGQLKGLGSGSSLASQEALLFDGECDNYDCSTIVEKTNSLCFLDGEPIVDGQTIEAYSQAEGDSCQSETRVCDKGQLKGTFEHSYCIEKALIENNQKPCVFNNKLVAHGQSVDAFLNGTPGTDKACQQEARTCNNGSLSGSFEYAQCQSPPSCLFNGRTYQANEYTAAYKYDENQNCVKEFRVCKDGLMTGSFPMASCQEKGKTCVFDNKTILSGESTIAYDSFNRVTQTCNQQIRTCQDGNLSGGLLTPYCRPPAEENGCRFAGSSKPSGAIFTAYKKVEDENGVRCLQQTRTCTDGELNGDETYTLAQCEETSAKSCLFRSAVNLTKLVINHGETIKSFRSRESDGISTCDSTSVISRCVDGTFEPAPQPYEYCKPLVLPGKSCNLNGQTLADGRSDRLYKSDSVQLQDNPTADCMDADKSIVVYCNDGTLVDPNTNQPIAAATVEAHPFQYCREYGAQCDYFDRKISHGVGFMIYKQATVDFDTQESCRDNGNALGGICHNGTLMDPNLTQALDISGYPSQTCEVSADSCNFRGQVYEHNEILRLSFYKDDSVPFVRMTEDGRDGSCTFNYNVQTPRCINGQIVELGQKTVNGERVWVPLDFDVYKFETCTVEGKACNAYGTTYPHGAKLGNRYTVANLPYVDETTSCESRQNRAALVCANGQLDEYQVGYSSTPYVQRVNINPDDFPSNTCRVVGADCVVGTNVYTHGSPVGERNRDRRDRDYGILFQKQEQTFSVNGDACFVNQQGTKARCLDGTVRNPLGEAVNTNIYKEITCEVTGTGCSLRGTNYNYNQLVRFYKNNEVTRDISNGLYCSSRTNSVSGRCRNGKFYESGSLDDLTEPAIEINVDEYPHNACRDL